ncbi:LysR family transcriptional regulator [Tabrizicola sp.]|uniref:LysR family transcriptional regulator n=1 Tax=Tabrizicola sp. TaxID=2005166 RepID=UPI002732C906|nr:LysR family transcriptional regulator [Tabrizicola sp.]MDP3198051.1 LysR substrate-binding domain-containing protein [Tabrizicola sp.]
MDKLSVMQAFCRIVDRGNFARAAEDLGVSATLLSREVRLLEENLGTMLITRTTRSMSLTQAGRVHYDEAKGILDAVHRVEDNIRESARAVVGHLQINAPLSFGQLVGAMLPAFLRCYPDLRVSPTLDDRVIDMVEGGFDLTLRIRSSLKVSTLRARRLGVVRVGISRHPVVWPERGTPTTPADLSAHVVVGYLLSEHLTRWDLRGPDGAFSLAVDPCARVSSSVVLRDLLIAGCGLGTLPDFISRAPEVSGALQRVLHRFELPPREIWAISTVGPSKHLRIAAFLDHLEQALARELPPSV